MTASFTPSTPARHSYGRETATMASCEDLEIPAPPFSPISDMSSELSDLSRSPSPSSEIFQFSPPTPPSTQNSSQGTPSPEDRSLYSTSSVDEERPHKRRRTSPPMPRETKRLDLEYLRSTANPEHQEQLDRLMKALHKRKKIVVVAGAGISVSAGIPDFRSSTGLFKSLKTEHKIKGSGKQLFDAAVYRDGPSTSSFHDMVRSLSSLTEKAESTPFHHLLARLAREDRLLRLYSQNVDGLDTSLKPLETRIPLPAKGPWPKTVQLHGGLDTMMCTKCQALSPFEADLFSGPIPPECKDCKQLDITRTEVAGKRSHGVGKLRPRMVLYNEFNPDSDAIGAVTKADLRRRPDAIIVVGTSLKIPGVKRIVREMCNIVRNHRDGIAVWINNDPEPTAKEFENSWDLIVKGTCDEIAQHASLRRWDDDSEEVDQEITEEDLAKIKERSHPHVVVESPSKPRVFASVDPLTPTSNDGSDLQTKLRNVCVESWAVKNPEEKLSAEKTTAGTSSPKIRLNMEKVQKVGGIPLSHILNSDDEAVIPIVRAKKTIAAKATAPRGRPKKDPAAPKRKRQTKAQKAQEAANSNHQISFSISKTNVPPITTKKPDGVVKESVGSVDDSNARTEAQPSANSISPQISTFSTFPLRETMSIFKAGSYQPQFPHQTGNTTDPCPNVQQSKGRLPLVPSPTSTNAKLPQPQRVVPPWVKSKVV